MWAWIILGALAILNAKNALFMWHFRFFWALFSGNRLKLTTRGTSSAPAAVLLSTVCTTHSPLLEIDFNLHKSNSTYFTDLDVSRAYLSGLLFGPLLLPTNKSGNGRQRCNLVVGSVSCDFKREVKPYLQYETVTRVLSWDEKWIYMVTHFVERGATARLGHGLFHHGSPRRSDNSDHSKSSSARASKDGKSVLLASAVTRLVFKRGRLTVTPERALEESGLILPLSTEPSGNEHDSIKSTSKALRDKVIARSKSHLQIARLQEGWDAVHGLLTGETAILARH